MRIEEIRNIPGPNVFSHLPVLVMTLDLEDLYGVDSHEPPGFVDRLLNAVPGLHEHYCSLGRCGGFVERLREGTWFGHIVEHVALELTDAAGISVNRGKTVSAGEPGKFHVAVTYKNEAGMRVLLETAVEFVEALLADRPFALEDRIVRARRAVQESSLGPSTQAIVDAAVARNIPYTLVSHSSSLLRFGYGVHSRFMQATVSGQTSAVALTIASDKHLTKSLLAEAGIPCPRGCVVRSAQEAVDALAKFGPSVVVKPLDGNQGNGVSLNLQTPDQVEEAYNVAAAFAANVIVEELVSGKDYRVLIVNGRLAAASEKTPAQVVGDGTHTIAQLIDIANQDPRRATDHSKPLSCIKIDAVITAALRRSDRTLDTIPQPGEIVVLRDSANLSTGGEAADVTDSVHPSNARAFERAARIIGLDICGLDLVLPDISLPLSDPANRTGGIVEVNAAPGIRMHCYPSRGTPRPVADDIVDMLFPNGSDGRIPIVSVTGTNGKTTTTRMIAHVIAASGKRVGLTSTDGIVIGGERLAEGDMSGPQSARIVLNDPSVEAAVLETARGGIARAGLGYDWSDVGVLTNIQADHFGQDGITCLEDVLKIKSLVAERVREGGTLVLNADDELLASLPQHPRVANLHRNVIFFSLRPRNKTVQRHVASGGTAFVLNHGYIEQRRGPEVRVLGHAAAMPCTFGGLAEFQIANVLASIAACAGYGLTPEFAMEQLAQFDTFAHNDGRLNVHECSGRLVMLDYGHNPAAIQSIARMLDSLEPSRKTAVLGVPGDRIDDLISESAREAAVGFHRILLREDRDLRGRAAGEVAALMESAVRRASPRVEVRTIVDEVEALSWALQHSQPGEVIVVFFEYKDRLETFLEQQRATRMGDFNSIRDLLQRVWPLSA